MPNNPSGVWTLRSFHMENVETKERSEPFGSAPLGTLILTPDGWMTALLTARDRAMPVTEADRASAFQKVVAYAGRYRLEAPDRLVTAVEVAWFAPWVGTDQVRTYRLDGDRLDLMTPAGRMPREGGEDVTVMGLLSWTRATGTAD